jgi:hypothetical protein
VIPVSPPDVMEVDDTAQHDHRMNRSFNNMRRMTMIVHPVLPASDEENDEEEDLADKTEAKDELSKAGG